MEDTKSAIRSHKKDKQYNDKMEKGKGTKNYLQNTTHKIKIEQQEPHKILESPRCSRKVTSSYSAGGCRHVTLATIPVKSH